MLRLVLLLLLLGWSMPCSGQPDLAASASPTPTPAPDAVTVKLNDRPLVTLQGLGEISAHDRQLVLEERLRSVLSELHPPYQITAQRDGDNLVLKCEGHYLVTVTRLDALAAGVDVDTLAGQWAQRLKNTLYQTYLENSDEYYKVALWHSFWAVIAAILLQALIRRICLKYLATPGVSLRSLLWLSCFAYILYQFPRTRFLSHSLERYALRPLLLLVVVGLCSLLISWVVRRALRHYFVHRERLRARVPQNSPRWRQRLHMVRDATQFVVSALLAVLSIIVYFSLLDLNLGAMLAGAGFIGVGLGFAAQDVLKDFTAGVNIMLEDQFGAGDVVTIDSFTGVVEHFTLRVTQIRDLTGSLITVPNSQIRIVQNLSNLWSQVDLSVPVALDTDLRKAMRVMEDTANQLRRDWPEHVLDAPQVLGVEKIAAYGVELRILLRTAPQQQFQVRRELLLRIIETFRLENIEIPLQHLRLMTPGSNGGFVTKMSPASAEQSVI
jgi:small-conductance mechanosensitive channel